MLTIFTKRIYYGYGHTLGPEQDTAFSDELKKMVYIGVAILDGCHTCCGKRNPACEVIKARLITCIAIPSNTYQCIFIFLIRRTTPRNTQRSKRGGIWRCLGNGVGNDAQFSN